MGSMGRNDRLDISSKTHSFDRKSRLFILVLIAATFVVYLPVWHAGFIWDDDAHVTENAALRSLDGLRRIWVELGAMPQYYPLVHTSFWVEYHLWGSEPFAYHVLSAVENRHCHLVAIYVPPGCRDCDGSVVDHA